MRLGSHLAFALVAVAAVPASAGTGKNGVQMNGVQMNGVQMNGVQMNGVQMNGVQMNGVQMNGVQVSGLTLNGTWLSGTIIDTQSTCSHSQKVGGAPLNGCSPCARVVAAKYPSCATTTWDQTCINEAWNSCAVDANKLVGGTFTASTSGGPVTLRLDAVNPAPNPNAMWLRLPNGRWVDANANKNPNTDVWLYSFSYRQRYGRFSIPVDICGTDEDGIKNAAIPVAGQWDDCAGDKSRRCGGKSSNAGFSLGCRKVGAIAKCVEQFGYKPWKYVTEYQGSGLSWPGGPTPVSHMQSLEKFHETCVRMVRGDYCGDGSAHTVDGTSIDVWDHTQTQYETLNLPGYQFEAEWTPDGASCMSVSRYQSFGGSTTPGPNDTIPDAIQQCSWLSPVQRTADGQVYIVDACATWHLDPQGPYTPGYVDWPRTTYIANKSVH